MRYDRNDYLHSPLVIAGRWIVDIVIVIVCAMFVNQYLGSTAVNNSRSMEPTLEAGDTLLINNAIYKLTNVKRFDLILYEDEDSQTWIKRVVGLPGETIVIKDGHLYVNDSLLDCEGHYDMIYVSGIAGTEITLGEDEYFVLGDWLEGSEDSRFEQVGNIKKDSIIGKVWFRISPISDLGPVQ